MAPKKSKKQSDDSNEGASEPGPQVQEATEEQSSELPQANPPPVTPTDPPAAPDSATPEHHEAPTDDSRTQESEPIDTSRTTTEEELREASEELKTLRLQLRLHTLEAEVAQSRRNIEQQKSRNKGNNQHTEPTPEQDQDAEEVPNPIASTAPDQPPTTLPVRTQPTPATSNTQDNSESEDEYSNKPPTKKAVSETYQGRTQRELQIFEANLENHFDIHHGYIRNSSRRKIAEALQCVSGDLMLHWQQHRKELDHSPTFDEFMKFLLHQVADPRTYTEQAVLKYLTARQKPTQSAREFATYVRGWEHHLPESMSEYFRRELFRAGLREELRIDLARFPRDDSVSTFEGFVSYVQGCEDQIRAAKEAEKRITNRGREPDRGPNGRGGKSANRSHGEGSSRSRPNDKPRDYQPSGHKRKATFTDKCFTCHQTGHKASDCPSAKDRNANKPKN